MRGAGILADTVKGLQGMENWLNAHPALLSLVKNTGNIASGVVWLKNLTPAGVVIGLVVNCGYEMVLGLMESNIEVSTERLASYVKGHDADITDEQARYLADCSMKVLRTVGKAVIHQVVARGFSAGRAVVGRQATKVAGRGASRATQAAKGVEREVVKKPKAVGIQGKYFGKLGIVVKNPNLNISDVSTHGLHQSITRGVSSPTILNTIQNPAIVLQQSGGNYLYLTKDAAIILNNKGRVVTTYPAPMFDKTILKVLEKTQK